VEKKKKIDCTINMRVVMDNLRYGWMCPMCETIFSPWLDRCPNNHKTSLGKVTQTDTQAWTIDTQTWTHDHDKSKIRIDRRK
jgi:hypothetical protein